MKRIVSVFLLMIFALVHGFQMHLILAAPHAKNGVILSGSDDSRKISLTFDDGPHPYKTEKILDLLERYHIRATFFVIGKNAAAYPDVLQRELALGHEIGNHTYSHKSLASCNAEFAEQEIAAAEDILIEKAGCAPTLFRPPEGAYTKEIAELATRLGYDIILWTIDTRDWAKVPAAKIVSSVEKKVKNGSIILFHDFTVNGAHTLEALEILIPKLLNMGYEFVTVSELIEKKSNK